jgi:hypothetical protein
MIPGDHPVVHSEDDVRQGQIIMARGWQVFEHSSPVVREVTGCASLERRKPGHRLGGVRPDECPDDLERVAGHHSPRTVRAIETLRDGALAADDRNRIRGEKGIAAERRASRGAVEKKKVRKAAQPLAAAHRVRGWDKRLDADRPALLTHRNHRRRSRRSQGNRATVGAPAVG